MDAKERLIQELIDGGYLKTPRIIKAFRAIDRADFVKPEYRSEAYGNYPLPIGEGQTISQPLTVAFMLELLDPQPSEKILDIGSGSGWTTALLAHICASKAEDLELRTKNSEKSEVTPPKTGKVFGLERIAELCEFGKKNLAKYFGEDRAKIICEDGTRGLPEEAPFSKILAGAAASHEIPPTWRDQLKVGGRIVAPVGGSIWRFTKKSDQEWQEEEFPGFAFVPLVKSVNAEKSYEIQPHQPLVKTHKPCESSKIFFFASCFLFLASAIILANEIYFPHPSYVGSKSVEISSGLGSRKIAELLKKEGVIRSRWAFIIYLSFKGRASELKPGRYIFGSTAIPEIMRDLVRGGTNEKVITILEGWNINDIAGYLQEKEIVSTEEFKKLVGFDFDFMAGGDNAPTFWKRFDFLESKPERVSFEGYLFPDTYRIFKDATAESITVKMLENFGKKVTSELRQEIKRQGRTLFEIITMASLIEKEVISDEDRMLVSGILWKRLKIGMALQVDATVNYITGKNAPRASIEDIKIASPYNTYKYRGLPLGPISNPGISAIRAALYPQKSPYLYYLSTPDGRTIFSKTLKEHNEAKIKYLTTAPGKD